MSIGAHLDQSIDIMEETRFKKKNVALIKKLAKQTHFNFPEMELIMLLYYKIQKNGPEKSPGVTKVQLREVLHAAFDMTDVDLTNSVVMSMVSGPSPYVPMEKFGKIMSIFLRGNLEEKIKHCFEVYDVMLRGFLTKDILVRFLAHCLVGNDEDSDDVIKDFADIIMKKTDVDRDSKISYDDFRTTMIKNPLLIECLGPCLPSRLAVHSVLQTIMPKVEKM